MHRRRPGRPRQLYDALFAECRGGTARVVATLIDAGADTNWVDEVGRCALYVACSSPRGSAAIVGTLLGRGADAQLAANGKAPLCVVCSHDDGCDRACLLLDYGADVNDDRYPGGRQPLALAAARGAEDLLSLLLDRGALINAKDAAGETALDAACKGSHVGAVRLLLGRNAHLRSCNPGVFDTGSLPYAAPPTVPFHTLQTDVARLVKEVCGLSIAAPTVNPRPVHPVAALLQFQEPTKWLDLRLAKRRAFLEHLRRAGFRQVLSTKPPSPKLRPSTSAPFGRNPKQRRFA